MSGTTSYQKNREAILNRAKNYYENNKEVLREKAKNKYREYGKNRCHNISEEKIKRI